MTVLYFMFYSRTGCHWLVSVSSKYVCVHSFNKQSKMNICFCSYKVNERT